jgi:lambda family phage minor tail protein L
MILDINKQRVTSDLVELYQVQVPSGYVYFTTYPTSVTFRDYYSPYTTRTYTPLPIAFTGYESKADGAYSRPRVTFANVLTTFKDALGSNDDLIGRKVIRRKTLFSQLTTGSGSTPPVELPKQIFIIDRIESESPTQVIFELAAPFDLANIKVPGRYIIPNTCAWIYQGNAADRSLQKIGGCTWRENNSNPGFAVYYDYNNYLIASSFATHTGGSYTKNVLYRVTKTLTRINENGSTTSVSGFDYWQAITNGSGVVVPSNFRRCRAYVAYNASTIYYNYKEGRLYSDVVLYNNKMWACTKSHSGQAPIEGSNFWERIDVCAKKLSSCAVRFKATQSDGVTLVDQNESIVLPYGGFPAARRFNR